MAPRDAPSPVIRLPASHPVSPAGPSRAAQPGRPPSELEESLIRLTNGIFFAGRTLQAALDMPPGVLRQAADRVLDVLDGTVRETRTAAYARRGDSADGVATAGDAGVVIRPGMGAQPGSSRAAGEDIVRLGKLRALEATLLCARSRDAQARTLELAARSAAVQDQVAASLRQAAARYPDRSADLRASSQAAASHATRMRQWAEDHPPPDSAAIAAPSQLVGP